jgi:uncharacterized membrane protein
LSEAATEMTASPFDIKTVLLAKHAQHVVVIHFPIALYIAGVLFDVLGRRSKNQRLLAAAYYNLMGAALFTLPAVITGILAWRWALEGQQLAGLLLLHLIGGSITSALLWAVALLHFRSRRSREAALGSYSLVFEGCVVVMVIVTAHLGGFLSGVNGG